MANEKNRPVIGKEYNRLTVLNRVEIEGRDWRSNRIRYACQCTCGTELLVKGGRLLSGHVKSCGCLQKEIQRRGNVQHGQSGTKEFAAWRGMIRRCYDKRCRDYPGYGGRGIKVCLRWRKSFSNFLADVGLAPSPKYELERNNNDGNYEPDNVRWATHKEQCRNRRSSRRVAVDGVTKTVTEWAEKTGVNRSIISRRLDQGWDAAVAISVPANATRYGNQNARRNW